MGLLLERLKKNKLLVSDGAWGTLLQAKGLQAGECPEEWNVSHAKDVQSVAAAYEKAGADIVLSDTFGGSRPKLKKFGFEKRVGELNEAGARNSLAGAPKCVVAASIGPTGEFLEPVGDMTETDMIAAYEEQLRAIHKGGVRALCIETMSALDEAVCAVKAARRVDPKFDVIVTMTFELGQQGFRTMMGVSPEQAAKELDKAGADIVGANCGNGMERMIEITRLLRSATQKPILIHANAGMPQLVDGKTVFKETPADLAGRVKAVVGAGAQIVGGCCGTTPEHIAAIRKEIEQLRK
jgi:5-methyltetrahydrofolate--homocysteine methyltransferase